MTTEIKRPIHKMGPIQSTLFGIAFLTMCAFGTSITATLLSDWKMEKAIPVEIKREEKILKITHYGNPRIIGRFFDLSDNTVAAYIPEINAVTSGPLLTFMSDSKIIESVDHELGHFYSEQFRIKHNIPKINTKNKYARFALEGIAGYFEHKTNNLPDTYTGNSQNLLDVNNIYQLYDGSYHFVKPILDADINKGILYLLKNIPTENDYKNQEQYQKKALESIVNKQ